MIEKTIDAGTALNIIPGLTRGRSRNRTAIAEAWMLAVALLLMAVSGAASALTVTASPNTCSSVTGIGTVAWSKPGNALARDRNYATASVNGTTTNYLQCTDFGFAIPSGATINGVTVSVERSSTVNGGSTDAAVRLVKAGAIGTVDRSSVTQYTDSDFVEDHGGANDLWGTTWTPADINAANFGTAFAATKTPYQWKSAQTVSVNQIQISVDYTVPVPVPFSCTPPANTPAGVALSCVCDTFGRSSLNPSTIYGANWIVSTSDATGIVPSIVNPGYLRLTNNTGNNAKAATVPAIFPASGNYISVEFQQYAYNGSGADGIALTLSDYATTAVPGAFGGSLGYAQKTGTACNTASCPGFAGGWIGVALDEFGNYQNPTEGRFGGPGSILESVGIRGSGSDVTGYNWLAGTGSLNPLIDNRGSTAPSLGYNYQVIVDARTPASTSVAVNRDTGAGYNSLINVPNIFTAATAQGFSQAAVPANWQISFTGSTGGSTNIHEISGLKICAQTIVPRSGGTASGFNAIDEAYGTPPSVAVQKYLTGDIYTKLVGTPFKLDVAALNNSQILSTYAISANKNVTLKLVDNSAGICVLDSTQPNYCSSTCTGAAAVAGGSQVMTFGSANSGQKQSADFTLNTAYSKLAAIISDGTTNACATDQFSVRPTGVASVVSGSSPNANNIGTLKAGEIFTLTATTAGVANNPSGYTGVLQLNPTAVSPATLVALVPVSFPAASPGTGSSTATANFTYGEVGSFQLAAYDPATDAATARGVYDSTWTTVDSGSQGDCIAGGSPGAAVYANTKDANGKYGCNFGLLKTADPPAVFGRFIPDHFEVSGSATAACTSGTPFTYMGQPFAVKLTVTAQNSVNVTTQNYTGTLAHLDGATATKWTSFGSYDSIGLWAMANNIGGIPACTAKFAVGTPFTTTRSCGTNVAATAARVAISGSPAPTGTWAAGVGTFAANMILNRASAVDGSYETLQIGVAPQDSDGAKTDTVTLDLDADATAGNERRRIATTTVRYGRIRLTNAYGSELLPLPVSFLAQYYQAGTGWTRNGDDTCSLVPVPTSAAGLTFYPAGTRNQLASGDVIARMRNASDTADVTSGNGALRFGQDNFRLTNPTNVATGPGGGHFGYVDVSPDLTATPWLQFDWSGTGTPSNPIARGTFGTYKSPVIYLRENY